MSEVRSDFIEDLPQVLKERIRCFVSGDLAVKDRQFVLYLPTVVLRKEHNPAFALACRIANLQTLPLLILATILDDSHLPSLPLPSHNGSDRVVLTARRLAFWIQALQSACMEWSNHGAVVATRVHGSGCRTPHHLSLLQHASVVVVDEPFVDPFVTYVERIERAAQTQRIPVYRVDGSTTVPPAAILQTRRNPDGSLHYVDPPNKAWQWEQRTKHKRKGHIFATVRQGCLDAPPIIVKSTNIISWGDCSFHEALPLEWKDLNKPSPGYRAWTVHELCSVDAFTWAVQWPDADATIPPCTQTDGREGWKRWRRFSRVALTNYSRYRNDVRLPHAVSRMSCYLNWGTVSIFQIISELYDCAKANPSHEKFHDEIVKWREIGYAHAFCNRFSYKSSEALPRWSLDYLADQYRQPCEGESRGYSLSDLTTASTNDATWNSMQKYLISTGELHNNARMTWGKTVVHWQKQAWTAAQLVAAMVYLNDRFALDGLSPPSYAGLLWCMGWCDKPGSGNSISWKPASRYRYGPDAFARAKAVLLQQDECLETNRSNVSIAVTPTSNKKARITEVLPTHRSSQKSITSFFHPKDDGTDRKKNILIEENDKKESSLM